MKEKEKIRRKGIKASKRLCWASFRKRPFSHKFHSDNKVDNGHAYIPPELQELQVYTVAEQLTPEEGILQYRNVTYHL